MEHAQLTALHPAFQINSLRSVDGPRVALLRDGNMIAVWSGPADTGTEIRAQLFTRDGTTIGSEFIVGDIQSGTPWREDDGYQVTALPDGGFVVTWAREDGYGTDLGIFAVRFSSTGRQIGEPTRLDTVDGFYEYDVSITALSNGGFAFTWTRYGADVSGDNDVHLRLFSSNLSPSTSEILVNQYVTNTQNFADTTQLANGNIVVTWRNYRDPDGSINTIYARVFDTAGRAVTDEIRVNTAGSGSTDPEIVALAGGGFLVAWHSSGSTIVAQRFDNAGTALGDQFTLSGNANFQRPVITALQDGGFVLMVRRGSTYDDDSIVIQRFDNEGAAVGRAFIVADNANFFEHAHDLVQGADGSLVAVWSAGSNNISNPPYAQVFRINAEPEGSVDISGVFEQGQTLTADPQITDTDGMSTSVLSFQWLRDGVDIEGATGSSYDLVQADVGRAISVEVSYTDDLGTPESVVSAEGTVGNINDPVQGQIVLRGDPIEGQAIFANTNGLEDSDGLGTFSYQWFLNGNAIAGQTNFGILLTQEHVGQSLSVRVSFVDVGGTTETVTSETLSVSNLNDLPGGDLLITGEAVEDGVLGLDTSGITDQDGLGSFAYQWLRNGVAIEGATGATLVLGDDDSGQMISGRIVYTDGYGTEETVDSASVAVINVNDLPDGSPTIQGTAAVGYELVADISTITDADGLGRFSYQWLRNGQEIQSAQTDSYVPVLDDLGAAISVRVQYTDGHGTFETLQSAASTIVRLNIPPVGAPEVTGTAILGATLIADTSAISDADGLGGFQYQWLRNEQPIIGATAESYILSAQDDGASISVRVTYRDGEGTTEVLTSAAETIRFPGNTPADGHVSISGQSPYYAGDVLNMDEIFTDPDGVASAFSRQWLRNGQPISGATNATYVLTEDDEGQQISAMSTYVDGLGYQEVLYSIGAITVIEVLDPPAPMNFSDQFWIITDPVHTPDDAFIAAVPNGGFVGVWNRNLEDGAGFGSYGLVVDANGTTVTPEFRINDQTDQHEVNPTVIGLPGGGFATTFYRDTNGYEPSEEGVFVQFYDETGNRVGDNITVFSGRMAIGGTYGPGVDGPQITALADGSLVVIWPRGYLDAGVYFQRISADGTLLGPVTQILSDTGNNYRPTVTANADGGFTAFWWSFTDDYQLGPAVLGQRFDANGNAVSDQFWVWSARSTSGPGSIAVINSTTNEEGYTAVVFSTTVWSNGVTPHLDTFVRIYDPNGNPVTDDAVRVHDYDTRNQFEASVAAVENGFLVVWETGIESDRFSEVHIMAQLFDLRGDASGDPIQINQNTTDRFSRPTVASNGNQVMVAWFDHAMANDPVLESGVGITGRTFTIGDGPSLPFAATENADSLIGTDGDDSIAGLGGDDVISGERGNDTVEGDEGNDTVSGGAGNDMVSGGDGNDTLLLGSGSDLAGGGAGADLITVDAANQGDINRIWAGAGNDTIRGNASADVIDAGDGNDTLVGGAGNDTLIGGTTQDDLRDVIYGGDGNDSIDGEYGNDELRGDAGSDTIVGGFGVDDIFGGTGDDQLTGQAWSDLIFGGDGNDFINGGFGYDRVNGGDGADRFFHLGVADHGSDWIQDYDATEGDVLVFGGSATRDQLQINFVETANAGDAGVEEAFVIYRPTGQILWALVDGGAQVSINLALSGTEYDLLA